MCQGDAVPLFAAGKCLRTYPPAFLPRFFFFFFSLSDVR